MKKSVGIVIICGLLIGGILLAQLGSVSANCTPDPANSGDTVDCTASDTNGVGTGAEDNVSVTVHNGATVDSSPLPAVDLNDNNTVVNDGTLNNSGGNAVEVGDNNIVTNNGTITSTSGAGIDACSQNSITNNGTIDTTGGPGIRACSNNNVTNTGDITANGDEGVVVFDNNVVTNTGTITSDLVGVEVNNNNALTNNGTIDASAGVAGIIAQDGNTIVNNGDIQGGSYAGVTVDDNNTLINNGTITAPTGSVGVRADGPATITNNGSISGDANGILGNDDAQVVINNGTITGVNGPAISLLGGNDQVVILFGTVINGVIDGGTGIDSFQIDIDSSNSDPATANAIAAAIASQCPDASNCTINVNGVVYYVTNFEGPAGTRIIVVTRAAKQAQVICDGDVKVMKSVDEKYYDVYSGFSNDLPNGFWVGRIDPKLVPEVLKFQDPGKFNPGWYVRVTPIENNLMILQVYAGSDNHPYGKICTVPL